MHHFFQRLASSTLYNFVEIGVYWHFQFITQLSELQSNLCMQILLEMGEGRPAWAVLPLWRILLAPHYKSKEYLISCKKDL